MKRALRWSPAAIATVVLVAAVVVINLVWVGLETRPPHWDMARHLWTSLQYLAVADHTPFKLMVPYFYYPPLIYFVAIPFYWALGVSVNAAVAANQVFLVVGALAVYLIGRRVSGRSLGGFLAALLFVTSPLISSQFREFQIDGPLACLTAVWLWCLMESDWFAKRNWSLALGAVTGLGLLCKWTFVAVVVLPATVAVGVAVWNSWRERRIGRLVNVAAAGLIAGFMAYYWYYPHRHQLRIDATANGNAQARLEGDPTGLTWQALTYYARNLLTTQLYLPALALFVAGAGIGIWKRKRELILPALLFVGTYAAFSVISNKDARYTLPLIPAAAVIAVWWIPSLQATWRRVVVGAVTVVTVGTLWAMNFGLPLLPGQIALGPTLLWAQHGYIVAQPSHEDWHLEGTMKVAQNSSLAYGGPDTIWLNSWAISYYATKYHIQLVPGVGQAHYLMIRATAIGNEPGYTKLNSYTLPDGMELTLYEKSK